MSSTATLDRHEDASVALQHHDPQPSIGETIEARINAAEATNRAAGQRGRSWALPGRHPALCWTSRDRWLIAVDVALMSDDGRRLCRTRHLSPTTARAIARGCAAYADSRTGRNLAASNRTISAHAAQRAGRSRPWSHDVVANTRHVLEALGLAVEVVRGRYLTAAERLAAAVHHDGVQLRAASTWALTIVRRWQVKSFLPRRGPTGSKTPRSRTSPKRAHARAQAPSGRSQRKPRQPRPLPAQIVTAQLLSRTHGLDNGRHIGPVIDVITDLVDCERWTGRDLATILNEDVRNRPRDWPQKIANPASFLRHRLLQLTDRLAGPSPSESAAEQHRALLAEQQSRVQERLVATANVASPETVKTRMAEIRAELSRRRSARDTSASVSGK